MEMKELKTKTDEELKKLLMETREKKRELRFKVAQKQLKNIREIRKLKIAAARILTIFGKNN